MTGGASWPHPSSSTLPSLGWPALCLDAPKGLKPAPPPLLRVGVKAGLDDTGGGGPDDAVGAPEYLEPDASDTFCTMPSGVRSRSDRAVICT